MNGRITVVSQRSDGRKAELDDSLVLIDRGSVFGNPFFITPGLNRDAAIEYYRRDLAISMASDGPIRRALYGLADRVQDGENIALLCWCAPLRCHGDVIKEEILKLIDKDRS